MNLHTKRSKGIKNYVWDPNADVENENFLTDFSWQIRAKKHKNKFVFRISENYRT